MYCGDRNTWTHLTVKDIAVRIQVHDWKPLRAGSQPISTFSVLTTLYIKPQVIIHETDINDFKPSVKRQQTFLSHNLGNSFSCSSPHYYYLSSLIEYVRIILLSRCRTLHVVIHLVLENERMTSLYFVIMLLCLDRYLF